MRLTVSIIGDREDLAIALGEIYKVGDDVYCRTTPSSTDPAAWEIFIWVGSIDAAFKLGMIIRPGVFFDLKIK